LPFRPSEQGKPRKILGRIGRINSLKGSRFAARRSNHFQISRERAQAIHQCSVLASRYPQYLWGNLEIYQYRACMAEHHQPE
jgi:hypothetical protein